MQFTIRQAIAQDIPELRELIAASARGLRFDCYSPEQVEGALGTFLGLDTTLVQDGTYFVVESEAKIVACGGWSRRKALFGSDHVPGKDDGWLDPQADAARIRAFFVRPGWERKGIGTLMMRHCEDEARARGFSRLELGATLPGVPLYIRHGFEAADRVELPLPNGLTLPIVHMSKRLESAAK